MSYTQFAASRAAVHRSNRRAKRRRAILGRVVPQKYGIITSWFRSLATASKENETVETED